MRASVWGAIVPAAGASTRMGFDKTVADIDGLPVLAHTLRSLASAGILRIWVGVRPGSESGVRDAVLPLVPGPEVHLVPGGATRHATVARCLDALPLDLGFVLVHDAARPHCTPRLVRRVADAAEAVGAACAALPAVDTIHHAAPDGTIAETPERAALWAAQTPQAFRRDILVRAHAGAGPHARSTDDAGLCASAGFPVALVEGERTNVKLTFADDLPAGHPPGLAVGHGYDVHRLVSGRPLVLGGVRIPHDRGLDGHSDADALCHALSDAVLGAAGLGDIGRWFPSSDPSFKDADSVRLLGDCVTLAAGRGWRPAQADCTVIAERPRLAPHVSAMRARLAAALGVQAEYVNVKAGTNEGLGWLGRCEGIAAQAVVLLERAARRSGPGAGLP